MECLGVKYVYDVREKSASQKKRVDIFKLETVRQRFVILRLKCTVGDHVGIPNAVVLFFLLFAFVRLMFMALTHLLQQSPSAT